MKKKTVVNEIVSSLDTLYSENIVNVSCGMRVLTECLYSMQDNMQDNKDIKSLVVDCSVVGDKLCKELSVIQTEVEEIKHRVSGLCETVDNPFRKDMIE